MYRGVFMSKLIKTIKKDLEIDFNTKIAFINFSCKKSQAATEYLLIILLVVITCIIFLKFLQLCTNNCYENIVFVLSMPIP